MQKRLQRQGFQVYRFCYHTITQTMRQNADTLSAFLKAKGIDACHFVGHSMGGLVIRQFLQDRPDFPPCRAVALGTPFAGSKVERQLVKWPLTRWIIGKKQGSSLENGAGAWIEKHKLGVIAGDRAIGIGMLLTPLSKPNDGVVSLKETEISGMTEHITIHSSHILLMFSKEAASATCCFLEHGSFWDRPTPVCQKSESHFTQGG